MSLHVCGKRLRNDCEATAKRLRSECVHLGENQLFASNKRDSHAQLAASAKACRASCRASCRSVQKRAEASCIMCTLLATRSNDTRALCAVSRSWAKLPPDVLKQLSATMFVHKSAVLMKSLKFTYVSEITSWDMSRTSYLRVCSTLPTSFLWACDRDVSGRNPYRDYCLSKFGNSVRDRYQIDSDRGSGITLGRALGMLPQMSDITCDFYRDDL